ncbi:hypothetical protein RclHR1_05700008 [Rhizophagus clarus]|uniref:Uncharacterized protein n=1 Tax=Rhizophagus clarus TaxID=94130 RepID=A0A2Z6RUK4_9GLOM|nr:hypothetical protein RclHR1_05700008 [Rhizophagus clarus]GES78799.1 hypothetical protein GLOIN_2v1782112 [Rhizophagus clarus]
MVEDDTIPLYLKTTEFPNSEHIIRQKVMSKNIYKKFAIYGFFVALLIFISYIATCKLLYPCDEENSTSAVDNSYEHYLGFKVDELFIEVRNWKNDDNDVEDFDWTEITK